MQKNFHIGKFFERARRRSLRLDITTRAIGVERSFLLSLTTYRVHKLPTARFPGRDAPRCPHRLRGRKREGVAAPPMTPPLSTPFLDCQGVSWAWLEAESRRARTITPNHFGGVTITNTTGRMVRGGWRENPRA